MDNGLRIEKKVGNVTIVANVEMEGGRRRCYITVSGAPSRKTLDAVARVQGSDLEPNWVVNQVAKTVDVK